MKNKNTTQKIHHIELSIVRLSTKMDFLINNHIKHIDDRLSLLEKGMIGLLCFAITNLLIVVYNLIF